MNRLTLLLDISFTVKYFQKEGFHCLKEKNGLEGVLSSLKLVK